MNAILGKEKNQKITEKLCLFAAAVGICAAPSLLPLPLPLLLLKRGKHGVELGLEVCEVGFELCGRLLAPATKKRMSRISITKKKFGLRQGSTFAGAKG